MTKGALYLRVSTIYQIDKDSIPLQKADLEALAKMLRLDSYEIFTDAGYSGKNTDRPAYIDMMQRIRSGEFTHLLVWKIDRISRNLLDFAKMYEELKKYNVTFISRNEQFDTSNAMGEAMLKIILVFAELERKMTSERVLSVMIDRAKKGLWNGANVPIGYRWNEKTKFPEPDPAESKTVRLIFDLYEKHRSSTYVVRFLRHHDIKTKRGGSWTTKTISDLIRNPIYKGVYTYNCRESARGKRKPESEWITVNVPDALIISLDQWENCNMIMNENAEKFGINTPGARTSKYTNIFAGLLTCGKCHKHMIAGGKDKPNQFGFRPTRYNCPTKYKYNECDNMSGSDIWIGNFIFNLIHSILLIPQDSSSAENIRGHLLKHLKHVKSIDDDGLSSLTGLFLDRSRTFYHDRWKQPLNETTSLNQLLKEKAKYGRALERLEDMYLFDDMSEKRYLTKKKPITERLRELDNQIAAAAGNNDEDFIQDQNMLENISAFFLKENLTGSTAVDFKKLSGMCEDTILKEFVNSVISDIEITDRKVTCVTFKNGLTLRFSY